MSDQGVTVYERLGGEAGLRRLVDRFYDLMDSLPEAERIRALHPTDLTSSRDKLYLFLSGWLGGPSLYIARYGHPRLRARHLPFPIVESEGEAWLLCMERALAEFDLDHELRAELLHTLRQTADHMRNVCRPTAAFIKALASFIRPIALSTAVLSLTFFSACAEHAADADSGGEGTEKEGGRMNKDVKIKTVMLAANLVVVAILCVFVLLTWATFNRVQEKAAEQHRLADAMQAALNARYHVVQIQQFLTDEADRAAESIKLLAELLPAYQTRVPELNRQIAELHTTGVEMAKAYMQSRDAGNVLMKAPDSGFDARSSKLAAEMKTVSDEVEWQLHDATATLHVAEGDARTLVIGSSVLLLLFVTLVFAFLYFKIVPPLASLQQSLTGINTGNGDLTRRITHKGRDGIGLIVEQFNIFVGDLQGIIRDVIHSSGRVAEVAAGMLDVSSKTSNGATRQKSEIDGVVVAMGEMANAVQNIAMNAVQAADAANQADSEGGRGKHVVHQAIDSITVLADEVNKAAEVIHRLENESGNIGKILDVIRDIADQTNLLALNAAIEAARAGEQGRGFAVVADEVRRLALRTQESTQQIRQMIELFQQEANTAAHVMEQGRDQAQRSVEEAAKAGASLDAITAAIKTISDMNIHTASAAEEQSVVSKEIDQNIANISHVGDETFRGATATTDLCRELAEQSTHLENLVARFRV